MGNGVSCFYPEGRELLRSAESGDIDEVKGVLNTDIALTRYRTLTMGNTAWHKAAKSGRLEVLMEMTTMLEAALLRQGKSLESKDPARILWKLGSSSKQVIQKLVNQKNHRGQTPLMVACAEGHDGCAKFLAECGADPFVTDKLRGQTCLHYAALNNHDAVIKELLKAIETPEHPGTVARLLAQGNMSGLTPLHYACYGEKLACVKMLLSFKANVTQPCEYGDVDWISIDAGSTPLHVAALKGNADIIKALLKAYVEVSGDLMPGNTQGNSSPTRRRDPRALRNEYGKLPYHLAVRRGHFHLTDWLDPSVPLRWLLTGEELEMSSEFGPPRLAVIAASVLHHKLMQQLDTIEALGLIRQSEAGPSSSSPPALDSEQPGPSGSSLPAGSTSASLVAAAEALSRKPSRRMLSRSGSKQLAEQLLRGMHRRASSSGRGLNPLLDEAILEQAAELVKLNSAPIEFSACMPSVGKRPGSRRVSREASMSTSPESPSNEPADGGRSAAGSRRTSKECVPGMVTSGERLDTVEEGTSRASSMATSLQHHLSSSIMVSPFARITTSASQINDDGSVHGGSSSIVRAKSAPQPRASDSSSTDSEQPLASISVHHAGSSSLKSMATTGMLNLPSKHSSDASKLDMLARIKIDISAEASEAGTCGSGPQQLPSTSSLLSQTPSMLLDAVLKPFRRSANRIQPAEQQAAGAAEADDDDENMCGVCLDVDVNALMMPCSHRICVSCARDLCRRYTVATALCPYCRAIISDFKPAF